MTPERLAEIRGRHYKREVANECVSLHCGGWPCDAGELLLHLDQISNAGKDDDDAFDRLEDRTGYGRLGAAWAAQSRAALPVDEEQS